MASISIQLQEQFGALQKGFVWNDIPNLAIITGVNGVGKTHLVKLLKGEELPSKTSVRNRINCQIIDSITHKPVRLILPLNQPNLTVAGLCAYQEKMMERQVEISQFQKNIDYYQGEIDRNIVQQSQTTDKIERLRISKDILNFKDAIDHNLREIEKRIIFPYEQELNKIASKLGQRVELLTREEIYVNADPYFNHLTEIEDFRKFISQDDQELTRRLADLAKEKNHDKSDLLVDMPRVYQRVNHLFAHFGFDYFEMQDPFPKDGGRNGDVEFLGKRGECVDYDVLSEGEKMIVKFVIWAMGKDIRGNQINTMILDEPDAHLHPKMCRMMIDILKEISKSKEEGGSGIRIILTTHTPSTVAFTPEENLFVMEKNEDNNRQIRQTTLLETMSILSEGIFTYDKAIGHFSIIGDTKHQNIVCVEGKTDVVHIKTAMQKLQRDLDIELLDLHDAGNLAYFIKSIPAYLLNGKRLIGLFDCDDEGKKGFNSISGDNIDNYKKLTGEHCRNNTFALILPPVNSDLEKYSPIEFLYPIDILKTNNVLDKRNYHDFRSTFRGKSLEEDTALGLEFNDETTLRPFKANDSVKNLFAEKVKSFDDSAFAGFNNLFDTLERIIKNN